MLTKPCIAADMYIYLPICTRLFSGLSSTGSVKAESSFLAQASLRLEENRKGALEVVAFLSAERDLAAPGMRQEMNSLVAIAFDLTEVAGQRREQILLGDTSSRTVSEVCTRLL